MLAPFTHRLQPLAPHSRVLVSSTCSDAHTWNLVYLELLVTEHGHEVLNLGACVSVDRLVRECASSAPGLVVLSSVNGHGVVDARAAIRAIRRDPQTASLPVVVGGKLTMTGHLSGRARRALLSAGFDAVLTGATAAADLTRLLDARRLLVPGT